MDLLLQVVGKMEQGQEEVIPRRRKRSICESDGLFLLSSSAPLDNCSPMMHALEEDSRTKKLYRVDDNASTSSSGTSQQRSNPRRRANSDATQIVPLKKIVHKANPSPVFIITQNETTPQHNKEISGDDLINLRSTLIEGVPQPLNLEPPCEPLQYDQLINFPRTRGKAQNRRCVMCGHFATGKEATCSIPLQNKDVCKRCDTGIWCHNATQQYFKWCKGCKKFLHVCAFAEKLLKCASKFSKQPSKCDRCRERGRQSYMSKRDTTQILTKNQCEEINHQENKEIFTSHNALKETQAPTTPRDEPSIQICLHENKLFSSASSTSTANAGTPETQNSPCALLFAAATSLHKPIPK
mmetsp:Transcript_9648/g.13379  ORF Transcript_9648/g.13379 Transcript_9648/m.13379 type:complete len:354 (+) Transcript_9648:159-1220(+)